MADDSSDKVKSDCGAVVSQKVLFVRNLPFSTTDQDLENVFSEIGPIKRCFVIRDKGTKGLCRGFGYVTFALAEDAERAKTVVKTFGGRQVNICFADKKPKHEKRKLKQSGNVNRDDDDDDGDNDENSNAKDKGVKGMSPEDHERKPPEKKFKHDKHSEMLKSRRKDIGNEIGRTVVISGLGTELSPNHIRKKCRKIGAVETVTFPVEGRDKPTAFVVFKSHKDAREAIKKLAGKVFKGNVIDILLLSREGKSPSQKSLKKSKVIVRNLSFKCKDEDLQKFFSQFGQVTEVHIPTKVEGKRKRSLGFGFVQFSNVFEAAKAIKESNMKEIVGRPVAVDWAVAKTVYEMKKSHEEENDEKEKSEIEDQDEEKRDEMEESGDDVSGSDNDISSDADSTEEGLDSSDKKGKEDEEDEESEVEQGRKPLQSRKSKQSSDVKEGKTLFIRNLSFDSSEESVHHLFERFGEIDYCKLLEDKRTGHSRGMAFVKFKTVESAEQCLAEPALSLDNFTLNVTKAVTPGKAAELAKERKAEGNKDVKDKRNLYLAKEGLILPGSTAAQGLSKGDLLKRQKAEVEKKAKLENPNYFVSPTRLCVRNLALNVDDKQLKEIFSTVTGRRAHVQKVLIIRSKDRVDSSGRGRSMGYGFVEFTNHKDALAALRATNNNPEIFGADRRPIVEFSLENSFVVKTKERRVDKARQRQGAEEHARGEQPKTNKERRLEMNQKRREKRQRKREAKKQRKLEQAKEGGGEKAVEETRVKKEEKIKSETSWKARKGSKIFPAAKSSTRTTNPAASHKFSKVKTNPKELKDINENIPKVVTSAIHSTANEAPVRLSRKRKGTRRKEQERKDETNFSDMVNKYKNKLFGKDESESPAKRSRWFDN